MSKLRVHSFSISLDGYGAGPDRGDRRRRGGNAALVPRAPQVFWMPVLWQTSLAARSGFTRRRAVVADSSSSHDDD
jgi:hypothetical protein